jgi:serralysin
MNMEELLKVDINVFLPEDLRFEAELRAIEINPENMPDPVTSDAPPDPLQLAVLRKKKWPSGHRLRVRFLDGHPAVQQRVMFFANQWTEYANLHFDFGSDPDAEIRISFDPRLGSWSYIGTDNLVVPKEKATMNFGWLKPGTSDETYSQVVLHEFGHAIGCVHEHSTPIAGVRWNKPVVYAYYSQFDWSKEDVDWNVFYVFEQGSTNHTEAFDSESIMVYPIPKEHTLDGFEVPWNSRLSSMDKQFIAQIYAKE